MHQALILQEETASKQQQRLEERFRNRENEMRSSEAELAIRSEDQTRKLGSDFETRLEALNRNLRDVESQNEIEKQHLETSYSRKQSVQETKFRELREEYDRDSKTRSERFAQLQVSKNELLQREQEMMLRMKQENKDRANQNMIELEQTREVLESSAQKQKEETLVQVSSLKLRIQELEAQHVSVMTENESRMSRQLEDTVRLYNEELDAVKRTFCVFESPHLRFNTIHVQVLRTNALNLCERNLRTVKLYLVRSGHHEYHRFDSLQRHHYKISRRRKLKQRQSQENVLRI
jgi:hypothetical protein